MGSRGGLWGHRGGYGVIGGVMGSWKGLWGHIGGDGVELSDPDLPLKWYKNGQLLKPSTK